MRSDNVFVGRQKVLDIIDRLVYDKTRQKHVFPMIGQGGVGKTWLLRKLYERYSADPTLKVVRIDYSESRAQSLPTLTRYFIAQLSDELPEDRLQEFVGMLDDVERLRQAGFDYERLRQEESKAYLFGMALISEHVASRKRIVILSDTIEAVKEQNDKINPTASLIENCVIVLAGRDYPFVLERYATYPDIYKGWEVHRVYRLKAFVKRETRKYFAALLPHLPAESQKKIHILTDGSPVLVSIAREWISRNLALPEELDLPLDELENADATMLAELRRRFRSSLIARVRQLGGAVDWAILFTAYLNRRYNIEILKIAIEISDDVEANSIDQQLRQLSFVRQSMMGGPLDEGGLLHDEAQRLVVENVWSIADPDGKLRRSLVARVLKQYYEPEIERLRVTARQKVARAIEIKLSTPDKALIPALVEEDWRRGELQIEYMDYAARLSKDYFWRYLDSLLNEADNYGSSVFETELIDTALHNLMGDDLDTPEYQIRVARLHLQRNDKVRAKRAALRVLAYSDVSASAAARANIVIAQCTRNAHEKLQYLNRALEQAKLPEVLTLKTRAHNELGLAYRKQCSWRQAINEYRNVLNLLEQDQHPDEFANTLNNLAFVQMLDGDPVAADNIAEEALMIRKRLGNRRGLALSYSVKGRIAEALGDTAQAERYHKTALALAESIGDEVNAARFRTNIAASERRAHNFRPARDLLKDGQKVDEPEVQARVFQELARIDLEEARACMEMGGFSNELVHKLYEGARANSNAALKIAREIENVHYVAESLLDLCLVSYYANQEQNKRAMQELEQIATKHNFKLELGRLQELQGHLLMLQGDQKQAFRYFSLACDTLSQYSPAAYWQTFRRARTELFQLAPNSRQEACEVIAQYFREVPPNELSRSFRELCTDAVLQL